MGTFFFFYIVVETGRMTVCLSVVTHWFYFQYDIGHMPFYKHIKLDSIPMNNLINL